MKKVFAIFALSLLCTVATAQAKWPFGAATFNVVTLTSKATTYSANVTNSYASYDFGTLDTTLALTLIPSSKLTSGATLLVRWKSDATARTVTPSGTYFISQGTTGTISKSKQATFVYDANKGKYVLTSFVQID